MFVRGAATRETQCKSCPKAGPGHGCRGEIEGGQGRLPPSYGSVLDQLVPQCPPLRAACAGRCRHYAAELAVGHHRHPSLPAGIARHALYPPIPLCSARCCSTMHCCLRRALTLSPQPGRYLVQQHLGPYLLNAARARLASSTATMAVKVAVGQMTAVGDQQKNYDTCSRLAQVPYCATSTCTHKPVPNCAALLLPLRRRPQKLELGFFSCRSASASSAPASRR